MVAVRKKGFRSIIKLSERIGGLLKRTKEVRGREQG